MLNKVKARFLIGVGGLVAVSFMVMIGYTIGSQSVSKQTEHQIRAEANKLVTKEKQEEKATVLSDDDNDGIKDEEDKNPKAWDAKVEGKVTTPKGTQPTVDQYKEKITNLPEGSKVVIKTQPDVSKADDNQSAVVTVTLPNGEEKDVTVPVVVTDTTTGDKDKDKYEPEVSKEEIEKGGRT